MPYTFNSSKKILFISPSLVGGGAERVLVNIINNLNTQKYDIALVLFSKTGELLNYINKNIKIIDLNKKTRWDFFKIFIRLRKIIKQEKPDTVISLQNYTNILLILATEFFKIKPKIILCEHGNHRAYLLKARLNFLKKLLMKITYPKADKIVAISETMRENIIADFKISPDKITCIYNPIPVDSIQKLSKEKITDKQFNKKNGLFIIAVGRLSQVKRFDILLKAFSIVVKEHKANLIILGQGELLDYLTDIAKKLKIYQYVKFQGFEKNPYAWISKADLFVLSSDTEGFPMVILESMACGTPIISTNCPTGPEEIITNWKNGILVPVADEKEMALAMITLLKDKQLRKKFSKEGINCSRKYNIDKIVPKYEALF